ncbi:MAG: pentapeptide repeat-containing protein [Sphingobacteriales bacterium]|nr:pentapeptide repeat-containing protein [Sphingobacteriales bacterium]
MSVLKQQLNRISAWLGLQHGIFTNPDEGLIGNIPWETLIAEEGPLSAFPFGKIISFAIKHSAIIHDPEEAAKILFALAYTKTFEEAVSASDAEQVITFKDIEYQAQAQKAALKKIPIDLDTWDWDKIQEQDFIKSFCAPYFSELLQNSGIDEKTRKRIESFIQKNLRYNIYNLLYEHETQYSELLKYLNNPVQVVALERHKRKRYEAKWREKYYEQVLEDPKGLRLADLYIEPRCGIFKHCCAQSKASENEFYKESFQPAQEPLHELVYTLLQGKKPTWKASREMETARVILLLGYPGQGKSSFCKRLLHDILSEQQPLPQPLYFVPLRKISDISLLKNNPVAVFENFVQNVSQTDIKETKIERAVLILDGLDELQMRHDLRHEDIAQLLLTLQTEAENRDLRLVLTSRYGYVDLEKLRQRPIIVLQLTRLDKHQQIAWLQKYRYYHPEIALSEAHLEQYHADKKTFEHIRELIDQPILLHLIATLKEVPQGSNIKRADIYRLLFDQLTERKWAREGQIEHLKAISNKKDLLRHSLQDLAFLMFKKRRDYLLKSEIDACIQKGEAKSLKKLIVILSKEGITDGLQGLMTTFYLHESEYSEQDKENYMVEFLHKSLQEYLAAEKIWRAIGEEGFLDEKSSGDAVIDTPLKALETLQSIFADRPLTAEMLDYLKEIMAIAPQEKNELLAQRLAAYMPDCLKKQFLFAYRAEEEDEPLSRATAVFYGYISILNNLPIEAKNYIPKENKQIYANLLRLCGIQKSGVLSLSHQDLSGADLRGADLRGADLSRADLSGADLRGADLRGADLRGADLMRAHLSLANLIGAKLSLANLIGANLIGANLIGANLSEANLSRANLSRANLSRAYLSRAYLSRADLSRADLREANLSLANLSGADLSGADLSDANLSGADLSDANLREVNLSDADLSGAKVERADWLEYWQQQPHPPLGIAALSQKYRVNTTSEEDTWGDKYYTILRR